MPTTLLLLIWSLAFFGGAAQKIAKATTAVAPPPQAAAAGMTRLDFSDDFNYRDTSFLDFGGENAKTWSASLWFMPGSARPADFTVSDSVLTIHNNAMSTVHNKAPYPGKTWLGGYIESRIYCTGHCGFYLSSYAWTKKSGEACGAGNCPKMADVARQLDQQYGGADEIDIAESYFSAPNNAGFTVHESGSGCGQGGWGTPDRTNQNSSVKFNSPVAGAWHTYGLLWTKSTLHWYLDNKLVVSAPAFRSSWQPSFIVYWVGPDKFDKKGANDPAIMKVDWVRVWERR